MSIKELQICSKSDNKCRKDFEREKMKCLSCGRVSEWNGQGKRTEFTPNRDFKRETGRRRDKKAKGTEGTQ